MYSLHPRVVKHVLNARLANYEIITEKLTNPVLHSKVAQTLKFGAKPSRKPPYDHKQFMYYHLNRYKFNVKGDIYTLTAIGNNQYRDNTGLIWQEVHTIKNVYHMPKLNYVTSVAGITKPYSRKFLRDDTGTIGGEFEMIIKHDGRRIDALTHEKYQETYNFGRTRNTIEHIKLDVDPHKENPNYVVGPTTGRVKIIELKK